MRTLAPSLPPGQALLQILLLVGAATLLLPSPWLKGSEALLALEILGLLLAATTVLFVSNREWTIPTSMTVFIICSTLSLSLYLIPVPADTWLHLPGRHFYWDIIQMLEQAGIPLANHSVSLDAHATAGMLLGILPSLGLFLTASALHTRKTYLLANLFVAVAAYQAAWGMTQYSSAGIPAHGSYTNRDHYVTLMEFALPISIALLIRQFTHRAQEQGIKPTFLSGAYLSATVLILLGGLFSMSRAGIPNLFLAALLTPLLLSSSRKTHTLLSITLFLGVVLSLAYWVGLIPIINRFIGDDPLQDARWIMFKQQLDAIQLFFPLGSGPGTFTDVYTAFQPLEKVGAGLVTHAHNDYLELLLETGLVGVGILIFFFALFLKGWVNILQTRQHPVFTLQVAAGIGLLCSLLHAFFDFNFHTLPHPIIFAFLAGIFFRVIRHNNSCTL